MRLNAQPENAFPFVRGVGVVQISAGKTIDTAQGRTARLNQAVPPLRLYLHNTEETKMKTDIKRGEIYYADLSPVVGSEQGGSRPVIILQNDKGNLHSNTTIVAAITGELDKAHLPTHVIFTADGMKKKSMALLEQIRTIDKSRLGRYVGKVDKATMGRIDHAVITSLGIKAMEELLK